MTEQSVDIDDHVNEAIRELIHDDTVAWSVTTCRKGGHMTHTWYTPSNIGIGEQPVGIQLIAHQIRNYVEQSNADIQDVAVAAAQIASDEQMYGMEYTEEF